NQTVLIEEQLDLIGHFHAAGTPGRHEPFDGEFNYPFLLRRLESAGYDRYIGLEYKPSLPPQESLARSLEYLRCRD
ncbi:MAG: TIM barrel protein, partial [Lentisphaerae bacterium]|nr:TIM barrel protein [Lentisphaerota bacterium]